MTIAYEPAGSEFQVNTTTFGHQMEPFVIALANGGFLVVWATGEIWAQLYAADGTPIGGEFQVNTYTDHLQEAPTAAGLADGSFVIIWESFGQDASNEGIYGQRYDAAGNPLGEEFQVNAYNSGYQKEPSITPLANGGFVVTWTSENQDGHNYGVFARLYDSDGNPVGGEFQVNSHYIGAQTLPAAAGLPDGGFVIVWSSANQDDGLSQGIYGQRYDANGSPVGSEFLVNTYTSGDQMEPAITALSDGGFVVTWHSAGQDGSGQGIYGQRYDASGTAVGAEFRVNTTTSGDQVLSSVDGLPEGGFVITWLSSDGSGLGVYSQVFDATGAPLGAESRVNTYTGSDQLYPSVAALDDGGFVIGWASLGQDGSGFGIFAQMFSATESDTTPPEAPTIDLYGPADSGQSDTDNITQDNRPQIEGFAEPGSTVNIYDGTTLLGTAVANSAGSWGFIPPTPLPDGIYELTATATDEAGNTSAPSAVLEITIDTTPPNPTLALATASDSGGINVDGVTNANMPTLEGTAEPGRTVQLHYGSSLLGVAVADDDGNWSFTPSAPLPDGTYEFVVFTTDIAGNTALSSYLTVTIDTAPPGAPTIAQTSPTSDTLPNLEGTAEAGSTITIYDSDGNVVATGILVDENGDWSYELGELADGDYVYSATATDAAGNESDSSSAAVSVVVSGNTVTGTNQSDVMEGTSGRDTLNGGNGNDTISGLWAPDQLFGGNGDDTLFGGGGADLLYGENGNDTLDGGYGNDTLDGGRGDDMLTGGSGDDLFVVGKNSGNDIITDFEIGSDALVLNDGVTIASLEYIGDDTIVYLSNDSTMILLSVTVASADYLIGG